MNRLLIAIFLIVSILAWGDTHEAASTSYADVATAVGLADDGDIVSIPAGESTWASTLTITVGIELKGSGIATTVITGNAVDLQLIRLFPGSNKPMRVHDIGFISGKPITIVADKTNSYCLNQIRIDHNSFVNGMDNIYNSGWCEGVIDNNYFENCNRAIIVAGDIDYAWGRTIETGTENALFIEDNTFVQTNAGGGGLNENIYHQDGARTVVRHNLFDGSAYTDYDFCVFDVHGNQAVYWYHGTQLRSQPIVEVYNNTFTYHHSYRVMYIRGGSVVVHDNTFTYVTTSVEIQLSEEEAWQSDWWGEDGLRSIWPAEDQIMNCFFWNNTRNGNPITDIYCAGASTTFIQEDRDYFMHAPESSGGKEYYNGRQGASNSAPTDLDGDTMIFTAEGPNAYYPYDAYVYPHPLRGEGGAGPFSKNLAMILLQIFGAVFSLMFLPFGLDCFLNP